MRLIDADELKKAIMAYKTMPQIRQAVCEVIDSMPTYGIDQAKGIITNHYSDTSGLSMETTTSYAKLDGMPMISTDFKMSKEMKDAFCIVCEDCGDKGIFAYQESEGD